MRHLRCSNVNALNTAVVRNEDKIFFDKMLKVGVGNLLKYCIV